MTTTSMRREHAEVSSTCGSFSAVRLLAPQDPLCVLPKACAALSYRSDHLQERVQMTACSWQPHGGVVVLLEPAFSPCASAHHNCVATPR